MTMRVLSVRGALPEHRHRQEEITESFTTTLVGDTVNRGIVERFHRNVCVETRHTVLPLEEYPGSRASARRTTSSSGPASSWALARSSTRSRASA